MKSKLLKRIGALAVAMTLVFANGVLATAAPGTATNGNAGQIATDGNAGQNQNKPGNQNQPEKDPDEWDTIYGNGYYMEAGTKTDAGYIAWIFNDSTLKKANVNTAISEALKDSHVIKESWLCFSVPDGVSVNKENLSVMKEKSMRLTANSDIARWDFSKVINAATDFNTDDIKVGNINDKAKAKLVNSNITSYIPLTISGIGSLPGNAYVSLKVADNISVCGDAYAYYYNSALDKFEYVSESYIYAGNQQKEAWTDISDVSKRGSYVLTREKLPDQLTTGTVVDAWTEYSETNKELADSAIDCIKNEANKGEIVKVFVPDGLKVSASVFKAAKDKGVKLQIKSAASTAVWNFADFSALSDSMKDFDPTVSVGEKIQAINDALGKLTVPAGMKSITVDFAFEGTLPGKTDVTLDLSAAGFANNATVYLYYYNPQTKQLEKSATGTYVDGYATFTITHCSQYLVTDKELAGAGKDNTPATSPASTKAPKTGDNNAVALYVVLCGLGVVVAAVAKRKRNA